ncbi:carbohydrate ABC transporter permease [Asticcacaulis excentricus]|uniref:Binding-protein-dependent transport systems inner membrane component n=1 Tax=Asticcacaulis excentricus (strain ATCC 15261 / DSM 4724 / KCTC 12464 / NCIMB 9791 / VKM B-1370 / CB 48) TaxID=573065 RepID=E8RLW2_ASTEC|nr:sugar ABC transporter permease [Asticcacaulis excentricus]ADU13781.1 binding-protein-dependent transport systems inner membrane component [Asticcacaulis excentricus CB 48]
MYSNKWIGSLYVTPFVIGFLLFTAFPFVASFVLSLTDARLQDQLGAANFVGLSNYTEMAADSTFRQSLGVTFAYVFITVPLKLAFALFIAVVLNFKLKGIGLFRTAFYLPSILGGSVAIAVVWRFVFAGDGLLNQALAGIGIGGVNWLGEPSTAMFSIVLLRLWQFGSAMVVFLAGLKAIPEDLYEAADLDGASRLKQFFMITLPLLTPVLFFNFIMQIVQAFQEFNGPYIITAGGPLKSSYLLPLMIYEEAFKYFNLGYSSALSWVLFIIIAVFTAVAFWSQKHWVFYAQDRDDKGGH